MVRLWHRLVRFWDRLRWVDRLRLVALGLMAGLAMVSGLKVNVAISQSVLSEAAKDQESNLALSTDLGDPRSPTRAYLDGLSAAVLPALVRRDPREVAHAVDRAQGDRYAGVEPRFVILALPDGTILASSDAHRFPVRSVVPDDLRKRFDAHDEGLKTDPGTDHAWLVRTLRINGFRAGRLFAEVDIPGLERGRRDERSRLRPQSNPAYNKAVGSFKQADYPAAEEALKLGETYYARANYTEAAAAFNTAATKAGAFDGNEARDPKKIMAPEALLKLGMSLARANQKQDACNALAIVLGEYDDDVFPNAIAGNTIAGNAIKDRAEDEKKKLGC
jgi:hypothetical protein